MVKALLTYLALVAAGLSPVRGLLDGFPSLELAEARASTVTRDRARHARPESETDRTRLVTSRFRLSSSLVRSCGQRSLETRRQSTRAEIELGSDTDSDR